MRFACLMFAIMLVPASGHARQAAAPPATIVATDKKTGCTLHLPRHFATRPITAEPARAPSRWGTSTMSWSGACRNRRATGEGVLRVLSGAAVIGAWYGSAENGRFGKGVIEDSAGFEAGQMTAAGQLMPLAHEEELAAITTASAIARRYAAQLESLSNMPSADHYRAKADAIDAMMLGE